MSANKLVRLAPPALRRLTVHRYAGLFPALVGDERDRLRESLRTGYDEDHAIVVTPSGEIVDGRNRRDLACELELHDVPVLVREFVDDAAIATYIASMNIARRHLAARQQRELAGRLVAIDGISTRQAGKLAGVSQSTAGRAACEARAQVSHADSPAPKSRTNGSDGKSYPATRPKSKSIPRVDPPNPKPDPRIARVRKALDLLAQMTSEAIPAEVRDALTGNELVALVAVLDVLATTSLRSQEHSGRHASTTVDSIIGRASAA